MTKKKDEKKHSNEEAGKNQNSVPADRRNDSEDTSKAETSNNNDVNPGSEEPELTIEQQLTAEVADWKAKTDSANDKYLRLSADFDNYRKRMLKERMDLVKTASESLLLSILPVIDDFDRAMVAIETAQDLEATKEGINLIYTKFKDFTKQNGVVEIEAKGQELNTDQHEAITKIPAPSDDLKGKIVEVIQKGYLLNDKVIRYAKVVIGE